MANSTTGRYMQFYKQHTTQEVVLQKAVIQSQAYMTTELKENGTNKTSENSFYSSQENSERTVYAEIAVAICM